MAQEQKVSSVIAKSKVTYPVDASAYQFLNVIGHGVSAVVYKATCLPLRSTVAIKAVDLERSPNLNLDSLRRETQTMALLSHPNLLTAHCSFIVGPSLWIVMPFMACGSLHSIITSSFPRGLDEPVIAIILRDTLKALDYLHCQGHVHRDIKASNILVDSDGTTKVADFGVVSGSMFENSSGSNLLTDVTGTPYWMAPEVLACKSYYGYNYKADMWSFGITALELAHGHPPLSNLPLAKALMSQASLQIASSGSSPNDKKFSKTFKEMVGMCLIVGDPSKRPSAEKLLKHPFFKKCKGSEHLLKIILKDLPSVEYRTAITIPRVDEDEEKISMKSRRISGWNFNEEILKMEPVFPKEHNAIKPITKIDEQIDTESEETITETLNVVAAVHEKPGEQLESTRALIEEQNVKANSQVMNHNGNQDEPCKTSLESEVETKDKTRRQDKVEMAEKESEEAMRLMMAAHLHSILSASLKQGEMVVGMMKMCGAADKICEDLRCLELWLQVQSLKMEIIKLQDEVDKHKRINQELESQHLKKKDESPTKDSS